MTWRRAVAVAVLVASAAGAWWWSRRAPTTTLDVVPRQNVLLITIDTLRADALGTDGGPAETPAIDGLAREGVRFDAAHAQAVLTLPSHATILTGQYPFTHGVRENSGYRLAAGAPTLAGWFKAAGYQTAAFVSAFPLDARFGLGAGFDTYDDHVGARAGSAFQMAERPASVTVPLAARWIDDAATRAPGTPWFVWLHVFDPHAPYQPPPPYDQKFAGRPYYGEVSAVDASLAPLFDALRRASASTFVALTADHGEGLGEHGEDAHGIFAYESTLRVPMILAELGAGRPRARAGEVSHAGARHIDLAPTLLEAAGLPVPGGLPGRTLLPAAERRADSPRPAYFEAMSGLLSHGWAPLTGLVHGRDKFIDLPLAERYDLGSDPRELTNLAGREPQRDRALQQTLATYAAGRPGAPAAEDPDVRARLNALGYASPSAAPGKTAFTEDDDPKRLIALDTALHRGLDAFLAGRFVDAEDLYQAVIDRRPTMAIAYRYLAAVEWQAGNPAAAIAVLRAGLARGAHDPRLAGQLGEYLSDTGDVAGALQVLEPLGRQNGADPDALTALGIALARARRAAEAARVFERLAVALPSSSVPWENLGVLALERHDLPAASAAFDAALARNPSSARAWTGRGAVAFERGDRDSAFAAWRTALTHDPGDLDALASLGLNLARAGQIDAARPLLDRYSRGASALRPAAERAEVARWLRR